MWEVDIMIKDTFTLPEITFVGGESQTITMTLTNSSGEEYDFEGGNAQLAIVDFENKSAPSNFPKTSSISASTSGNYCVVTFSLVPSDTINISGKYIYQISIKDDDDNMYIPNRGIMYIIDNINKAFIPTPSQSNE